MINISVYITLSTSQGVPNQTARTTTVTATVTVHYNGGSYNGTSPAGILTVDGSSVGFNCNFNYAGVGQGAATTGSGSVVACTSTFTVSYGSASTRTVYVHASFASGTASGTVTANTSISLTPISSGSGSGGSSGEDSGEDSGVVSPGNPGGNWVLAPGNATIDGQTHYDSYSQRFYDYTGSTAFIGHDFNQTYWTEEYIVAIVRFRTPVFEGKSTYVDIALQADDNTNIGPVNVALCSSDENCYSYIKASDTVEDEYQIATAPLLTSVSNNDGAIYQSIIETSELNSDTYYYLIMWLVYPTASENNMRLIRLNYGCHSIDVYYKETSPGYIDVSTGYEPCSYYIHDGTKYKKCSPHIDTGTEWIKL